MVTMQSKHRHGAALDSSDKLSAGLDTLLFLILDPHSRFLYQAQVVSKDIVHGAIWDPMGKGKIPTVSIPVLLHISGDSGGDRYPWSTWFS